MRRPRGSRCTKSRPARASMHARAVVTIRDRAKAALANLDRSKSALAGKHASERVHARTTAITSRE